MNFQICSGNQERPGVTKEKDIISFSRQAVENAVCYLLLYPKDHSPVLRIPMKVQGRCNTEYTVGIRGLDWKNYDYNFEVNGEEVTDFYARRITGREIWADAARRPREQKAEGFVPQWEKAGTRQEQVRKKAGSKVKEINGNTENIVENKIKSSFYFSNFKWKDKDYRGVKKEDMVIYKLHMRGFSMGMKGNHHRRGTVEAVERKLEYLKGLGVTSLLFMPIYEFEEILMLDKSKEEYQPKDVINYWGYTMGNYFAPKASYLGKDHNPDHLKHLIQKIHEKQMECILEFYFSEKMNPHFIFDILHYWHEEYHVDGFRLLGSPRLAELLALDYKLSGCKLFFEGFQEDLAQDHQRFGPQLFSYNDEFLYEVRKVLNRQEGSIYEFACQMRRQQEHQGFVNYIAENNGFTLWDVFSYEHKHNEQNCEGNQDGSDWNYSENCGQEGISRRRQVNDLRKRQVKNALTIVFLAQGIPLIWMGDECGNSQRGNNNAYCQDNEIGWKDWRDSAAGRQIMAHVKRLSKIRAAYPILRQPRPFLLQDYENRGCPDLSYHSDGAWKIDFDRNRRFIGMFYSGKYAQTEESLYVAYNFQRVPQKFALPKGMKWKVLLNTAKESVTELDMQEELEIRELLVEEQSICLLAGRECTVEKSGKRKNIRREYRKKEMDKGTKEEGFNREAKTGPKK